VGHSVLYLQTKSLSGFLSLALLHSLVTLLLSLYCPCSFFLAFIPFSRSSPNFILCVCLHTSYKCKAVPLQAWSGPEGSRKLRFPDFMTTAQDGSKVVSLTHRTPLPPGNKPGTLFCWRLSRTQGHSATGRIMSLKNSNDTIGNRTRDLPVYLA
jgi:hypothetical protein